MGCLGSAGVLIALLIAVPVVVIGWKVVTRESVEELAGRLGAHAHIQELPEGATVVEPDGLRCRTGGWTRSSSCDLVYATTLDLAELRSLYRSRYGTWRSGIDNRAGGRSSIWRMEWSTFEWDLYIWVTVHDPATWPGPSPPGTVLVGHVGIHDGS